MVLTGASPFVSRSRIEQIVRRYVGADMQIDVDVRSEIPLTRSGKRRIVVSHLNTKSSGEPPFPHFAVGPSYSLSVDVWLINPRVI